MKPIHSLIFIALIVLMASCQKDNGYMGTIKITGPNLTTPPCAPVFNGIWQGTTASDSLTSLSNTPASLGLDTTNVYPVYMKINWITHTPSCQGQITVTSYQRL